MIEDTTVLALHDTNVHPEPFLHWAYPVEDGWVHQPVERMMVNQLHEQGYDAFCLHTSKAQHGPDFKWRHGLTIMQKFRRLTVGSVVEQELSSSRIDRSASTAVA